MVAEDELAHFLFKANEDGTYTIQNAGTGFYNGPETGSGNTTYDNRPIQWYEPDSITIIPFGEGQIGLRLKSGRYFYQNPAWLDYGMTYETHDGTQGLGSKYAWIPLLPTSLTDAVQQTDSAAQAADTIRLLRRPVRIGTLASWVVLKKLTPKLPRGSGSNPCWMVKLLCVALTIST